MKTESLVRQARTAEQHEVSRTLRELAPASCRIETAQGRPSRLTPAGTILPYRGNYRLRIVTNFRAEDDPVPRILDLPAFVEVDSAHREIDAEGRCVFTLPLRVPCSLLSVANLSKIFVKPGDLEVRVQTKSNSECRVVCPICAAPGSWLIVLSLLAASTPLLWSIVGAVLFSEGDPIESLTARLRPLLTFQRWLWGLGIAAIFYLGIWAINQVLLYQRCRELRRDFREKYPESPRLEA